jgi:type VI secretion system protein ImpL
MRVFKILFGWMLHRRFISFIGILLLGLLIWFIGPLIAIAGVEPLESSGARLLIIGIILIWWTISNIWSLIQSQKNNSKVIDALTSSPPDLHATADSVSQEEIETLNRGFKEALSILKKAKLGGRGNRRHLYQLPWYLIVGPPGAGKSTALKNSGLKFPLREHLRKDYIQGVGGTRNCDWWFTDEAVLLDTAGRYTTQDSDASIDSAAWSGFLQLLKKYRRRRPIDGIIVAFSLSDLIQQDAHQRQLHSRAVRKRLQEVTEEFQVKVPVYFMLTKCDLIAGFNEFFDDLAKDEREQVWGITFPMEGVESGRDPTNLFGPEYNAIMERLHRRMLARLDQERNPQRRGAIYGFKQQMASLERLLQDFLSETFQPSQFEEPILFRGIYFSSGTQEGTPLDRVISSISGTFGLEQQSMPAFSGTGRSFFLTKLFSDLVFHEANLVGKTGFFEKQRSLIQNIAYSVAFLVIFSSTTAWYISFKNNQKYIVEVQEQTNNYRNLFVPTAVEQGNISDMLSPMSTLRDIPGGYSDEEGSSPLSMGFGLNQEGKLGAAAKSAYFRVLNGRFLPYMIDRLESQIRGNVNQNDILYQALKAYLMLGYPDYLEWEFVHAWLSVDLERSLPGDINEQMRNDFQQHLTNLQDAPTLTPTLKKTLINQARENISRRPLAKWIYAKIKSQTHLEGINEWRLSDKIENGAIHFQRKSGESMSRGIPGLFTFKGYKKSFLAKLPNQIEEATSERWVLGEKYSKKMGKSDPIKLTQKVTNLYFQEYIRLWKDYISDIDIKNIANLSEAVNSLHVLSESNSPIKRLLVAISEETQLTKTSLPLGGLGKISEKAQGITEKLRGIFSKAPIPEAQEIIINPASIVDRQFNKIYQLTKLSKDTEPPIDRALKALNDLYIHTSVIQSRGGFALKNNANDIFVRTKILAKNQAQPLSRWMLALVNSTSRTISRTVVIAKTSDLDRKWQEVVQFCHDALGSRYPLVKNSPDDATLNDFARFFGPQGSMAKFFENNLRDFVDSSSQPWRVRPKNGIRIKISKDALRQFEYAAKIKNAFFSDGSSQPVIKFQIKPVTLGKSARWVELDLGGQRLKFRNDAVRYKTMHWPPPSGSTLARLIFKSKHSAKETGVALEGPWALFRLIDSGTRINSTLRNKFRFLIRIKDQTASFELDSGSVENPFRLNENGRFRCLNHL